jgi:SAM-dependent methyltransferase
MTPSLVRSLAARAAVLSQLRQEVAQCPNFSLLRLRRIESEIKSSGQWLAVKALAAEAATRLRLEDTYIEDARKYLRVDYWLRVNVLRAAGLGLHEGHPKSVLDLGSGTGLFPFVCRHFGHSAEGLDRSPSEMDGYETVVYQGMTQQLGMPIIRGHIEGFRPLGLCRRYDLISAFMVCFNRHKRADEWGCDEWRFFVDEMSGSLNDGGKLVLAFNPHEERYGRSRYFDGATRAFFASRGQVGDDGLVILHA